MGRCEAKALDEISRIQVEVPSDDCVQKNAESRLPPLEFRAIWRVVRSFTTRALLPVLSFS